MFQVEMCSTKKERVGKTVSHRVTARRRAQRDNAFSIDQNVIISSSLAIAKLIFLGRVSPTPVNSPVY